MDLNSQLPSSQLFERDEFSRFLHFFQKYEITTVDIMTKGVKDLVEMTSLSLAKHYQGTALHGKSAMTSKDFIVLKDILNKEIDVKLKIEGYDGACSKEANDLHKESSNVDPMTSTPKRFTTGSLKLDKILGGGIPLGYVTEISGESSSGKTQLLIQLALYCQIPETMGGLSTDKTKAKVFFLSTEAMLPITRIIQLQKKMFLNNSNFTKQVGDPEEAGPALENIISHFISKNWDQQSELLLFHQLPKLLSRDKSIKILIIDSISHHLRSGLNGGGAKENSTFEEQWNYNVDVNLYLDRLYGHLQKIAEKFGIAVVISNQVTSIPVENEGLQKIDCLDRDYQLGWLHGWDLFEISKDQIDSHQLSKFSGGSRDGRFCIFAPSESSEYVKKSVDITGNPSYRSQRNNIDEDEEENQNLPKPVMAFNRTVPCLSLQWANRIPTRLFLSKTTNPFEINSKRMEINEQLRMRELAFKQQRIRKLTQHSVRKIEKLQNYRKSFVEQNHEKDFAKTLAIIDRHIEFEQRRLQKYEIHAYKNDDRRLRLINLQDIREVGYDKKHFFVRLTNSVFGGHLQTLEVRISDKGYKCV
ncbi:putative DNA-dependent ATPase [Saccharomycopsis crataegensis]|uniref:DNA-dependent ATPase n=1 Tax=Saccharomycopsis crataegensis TaxID=43959 RepID=A0AAV5QKK2_9ASCO|nr:putative DNA-dependent ATPase [Saccharomycopsis crataegensis]